MAFFLKKIHLLTSLFVVVIVIASNNLYSQTFITCDVDGSEYKGKIEDAVQVSMGNENFIQVKSIEGEHILYLYIKLSKIKDVVPTTLNNKGNDAEKGELPDAEVVWVPDGPDNPQWNTVDGNLTVTQFDPETKTISGTFEFTAEKFEYSSKAKEDRPSVNLKEGKFDSLKYRIEENK